MPRQKQAREISQPEASRPHMPGYGLTTAPGGKGLLPWSWASQRIAKARRYWVATTRPNGRPHAMPVWGVWIENRFYFSTGARSRKARNLAAIPSCVIGMEEGIRAVIVEGVAQKIRGSKPPAAANKAYREKYKMGLDPKLGPIFCVRPQVVFGFIESETEFATTATRWVFGGKQQTF